MPAPKHPPPIIAAEESVVLPASFTRAPKNLDDAVSQISGKHDAGIPSSSSTRVSSYLVFARSISIMQEALAGSVL